MRCFAKGPCILDSRQYFVEFLLRICRHGTDRNSRRYGVTEKGPHTQQMETIVIKTVEIQYFVEFLLGIAVMGRIVIFVGVELCKGLNTQHFVGIGCFEKGSNTKIGTVYGRRVVNRYVADR